MASDAIQALDDALSDEGEDIILRRVVGTTNQQNVDCDCRSAVRSPSAEELVGGITQDDLFCILSPTQINNRQWPGGQPITATDDPRIPSKNRGDKAYVRGRWRAVQWGQGFYPQGELVRIEMRVLG
jgi:hypothetical protein